MLQVPFGMKMGAKVSVGSYIVHSMIPVFIGNTIAGATPTRSPDNLLLISGGTDLSLSQTAACAQHCKVSDIKACPDKAGRQQAHAAPASQRCLARLHLVLS